MIFTPPPRLARAVERAAQLRATGMGWVEVARKLNRPVSTVINWPYRYRDHWNELIAANQHTVATDAYSEAIAALRVLLRSDNERIRRDAAKAIADHCAPVAPAPGQPPITDLNRFADYLEGLSDEELAAILGTANLRELEGLEGGTGGAGAPPGAG